MDIVNFILSVVDKGQLQILAYLCGANFILGTVAALSKGKFELVQLMGFWRRVLVVFGSYSAVAIAAKGLADFTPLREAIWLALLAYLTAQIISNITELTGITIPAGLKKLIER